MSSSDTSWEITRQRGWFRYVVVRYAFIHGLPLGIGIPVVNYLILPALGYDVLGRLAVSVPLYVFGFGVCGACLWLFNERKRGAPTVQKTSD